MSGGAPSGVIHEPSSVLPLALVAVTFPMGASQEPADRAGITRVLGEVWLRGCLGPRARDAESMGQTLDRLGAELRTHVGLSYVTVTLEVLRRHLDDAVGWLADVLAHPRLTEVDLRRAVSRLDGDLVADRDDDAELCARALRRQLFGDHPHGRVPAGTRDGLRSITLDDLAAHRGRVMRDPIIGVAGDVDADSAAAIGARLREATSNPAPPPRPPPIEEPAPLAGRRLVVVDKPDRAQVQLAIGGLGTHPHDPDYLAFQVGLSILGGSHTSVLTQAIRVARGWSYDASASFTISRVREQFALWAAPAAEDAPACLAEMVHILERFTRHGISAPQMAFARRHLKGAWAFEVDTADKRLFLAIDRTLYDLPPNHHDAYPVRLEALEAKAVNDALRARIAPRSLWVAAVGDADVIAGPLQTAAAADDELVVVPYDA